MKHFFLIAFTAMWFLQLTAENKKNEFSHWSATIEAGANKFDADIMQKYNEIIPNAVSKISAGASLEYNITPVWSMGLDYYYLPYAAKGSYYSLTGESHNTKFFTAFNVVKMFVPDNKSRLNIWATLGAGISFYGVDYKTNNNGLKNSEGNTDRNANFNDGRAMNLPVGALVEYNLTKSLALGAKVQYIAYNKDNLDGRNYWGVTNDFASLGTLQLRWKFNAIKKHHLRNISVNEFLNNENQPDKLEQEIQKLQDKLDSLQKKIDKLPVETDKPIEPKNPDNTQNLNGGSSISDKDKNDNPDNEQPVILPEGENTDGDGDGVPDNRDKEPDTPANVPVDFWGRKITNPTLIDGTASVYFDFDKTDLDEEAEIAIHKIAQMLKSDNELVVEVRGFADYIGNQNYNLKLSQRRSDKVKERLVNIYGIESERIISNGLGKLYEPRIAFRGNRRCNFYLSK